MSTGRPPPGSIPTLTEVVSWPSVVPTAPVTAEEPAAGPLPPVAAAAPHPGEPPPIALAASATPALDEAELTQRILADVQRQIDMVLEVRLREVLAPVLARANDTLVRDARKELTSVMRDVVARSVAHELGRKP
ncbi:MAG: hypothetical protein ABI281_00675 [Caldimonas sp.]